MLCRTFLRQSPVTCLILAGALVPATPLFILGQECSSFAAQTYENLKTQSDDLRETLLLEQQRGNAANRQIWNNAEVAVTDIYDFNLGLFLGRAEDYEKLVQTLDQADMAFKSGNGTFAMSRTLSVFKQARALTLRVGGTLAPSPYTTLPTSPKEAKDFVEDALKVVKQYTVDGKGQVVALANTGDAMADSENSNLSQASLRQKIATINRCMSYAPHVGFTPSKKDASTNSSPHNPASSSDGGGDYQAQRQALLDRAAADSKAWDACLVASRTCVNSCSDPGFLACLRSCNLAENQCVDPLMKDRAQAMRSLDDLDANYKNGRAPPK